MGNSSFFLGFMVVDKKPETLGNGLRLIDIYSQKFCSQLSKLYTLNEACTPGPGPAK